MKFLTWALTLSFLLNPIMSQASTEPSLSTEEQQELVQYVQENTTPSDVEKVEGSSLQLLGRGILNKETKDLIALACVNQSKDQNEGCDQVRYVFFSKQNRKCLLLRQCD